MGKSMKAILALDQGTTSSRAVLFDQTGRVLGTGRRPFSQIYPQPGWVEHDPGEIWNSQLEAILEAISEAALSPAQIAGLGISNQRETTIVWNRQTGLPICNAIVWQCRRSAPLCDELKEKGLGKLIQGKTGLLPDPYFSATKIAWILDNIPGARKLALQGDLLFGTVDTWLIWKLTGGKVHATDVSNASRTMLFNIHEICWDEELLKLFDIPGNMLPEVRPSSGRFGTVDTDISGMCGTVIAGVAGDQQAALFGQGCFEAGSAKNTYGTGCFLLLNTGTEAISSRHNLLTTIAWQIGNKVEYALEGSIFTAGAAIQWLRDEMELLESAGESETLARQVADTNEVYLVPAFTGMGAPYWSSGARGALLGITRGASRAHVVRAALEAIAYQTRDVLDAMQQDAGIKLSQIKADGGAAANNFLMQFQSDIMNVSVFRPESVEASAFGAAALAGLATGFWNSRSELKTLSQNGKTFEPAMPENQRELLYSGWCDAVRKALE